MNKVECSFINEQQEIEKSHKDKKMKLRDKKMKVSESLKGKRAKITLENGSVSGTIREVTFAYISLKNPQPPKFMGGDQCIQFEDILKIKEL